MLDQFLIPKTILLILDINDFPDDQEAQDLHATRHEKHDISSSCVEKSHHILGIDQGEHSADDQRNRTDDHAAAAAGRCQHANVGRLP